MKHLEPLNVFRDSFDVLLSSILGAGDAFFVGGGCHFLPRSRDHRVEVLSPLVKDNLASMIQPELHQRMSLLR